MRGACTDYQEKIEFDAVIVTKLYQSMSTYQNSTIALAPALEEGLSSKSDMYSVLMEWSKYFSKPEQIGYEDTLSEKPFKVERILEMLMSKGIVIPEPAEILDYLSEYPEMTDLMLSACIKAKEMFDDDTQLSLEYYSDPEIDDGYPTLCVRHTNYNKHILNKIDELRAGCEDELSHQSGWFLVTTDFQKPRALRL